MALAWTLLFTKLPLDAWMVFLQLASKQTLQGRLRQTTCNHSWQKSTGTVVITSFHWGGRANSSISAGPTCAFVCGRLQRIWHLGISSAPCWIAGGTQGISACLLEVGQVANHLWQLFWKTSCSQMALPLLFPWFHWADLRQSHWQKNCGSSSVCGGNSRLYTVYSVWICTYIWCCLITFPLNPSWKN